MANNRESSQSAPVARPASQHLDGLVGQIFLRQLLPDVFSLLSVVLWLAFVIVLSLVSIVVPALAAAGATVRQALAYE